MVWEKHLLVLFTLIDLLILEREVTISGKVVFLRVEGDNI